MSISSRSLFLALAMMASSGPALGMGTAWSWVRTAAQKVRTIARPDSFMQHWALTRAALNIDANLPLPVGINGVMRAANYVNLVDRAWNDTDTLMAQKLKAIQDLRSRTKSSKKKKSFKKKAQTVVTHTHTKKKKQRQSSDVPGVASLPVGIGGLGLRLLRQPKTTVTKKITAADHDELVAKTFAALTLMHKKKLISESVFHKAKRVAGALAMSVATDYVSDSVGNPLQMRADKVIMRTFNTPYGWIESLTKGGIITKIAQGIALEAAGTAIGIGSGMVSFLGVSALAALAKTALGWVV